MRGLALAVALFAGALLAAPPVHAITMETSLSASGGSGDASDQSLETLGLFFGDSANLFPDLVLSSSAVGTTMFADASNGPVFAQAAAYLSDGTSGFVALGLGSSGPFVTYLTWPEPSLPPGEIERIGFRLDSIGFDVPGSDPNHDGVWGDYAFDATLLVVVPEPAPLALCALALASLALRRRAARTA